MKQSKSTVGYVSPEGVILKDHSVFNNGELVVVLSAQSVDEFFNSINEFKINLEKSKKWRDEIKKIKENNFD